MSYPFLLIRRFLVIGFCWPLLTSAQTVNLTVNANQAVRAAPVDERVFGLNAVLWDGQTGSAQTISLLQAAEVRTIRIPGGSLSDEYHWRTNTNLANTWTWSAGFDKFAALITGLNAQVFVTVNYGTGTPEEAAAWVAYANAPTNIVGTASDVSIGVDSKGYDWKTAGYWSALRAAAPLGTNDGMNFLRLSRSSPFGLKYWEIGNENYGTWETDEQAVKNDPYTYAVRTKTYVTKMKAVDPTIKIGVVAQPKETDNVNNTSHPATNPRTGVVRNGWTPVMLATLKAAPAWTPDYLIYHRYDQAPAADQPANPETDAGLLQKAKTWPQDAADLRQQLKDYLGETEAAKVELNVTENNSVYAKPGKQTTSLVNGLFYADSIGNLLQTEFNALAWWDLRNGQDNANNNSASLYGWRQYGDYGIISSPSSFGSATAYDPYPTYYAMKLVSKFARGGDTIVQATSGSSLLSLFAAKRTDGSLALLVINKDPTNSATASLALTGFTPAASATVYTYGKPQDDAAKPAGTGSPDLAQSSMSVAGATFTASFSTYSVTVLVIASNTAPVAAAVTTAPVARTVTSGQGTTFTVTASGNPAPGFQWQRLSSGSTAWENLLEGGSYRGVTTSTLTIDPTAAGMSGDQFRVVLTNASGSLTSSAVALTITGAGLLQYPAGIAADGSGNLFVADSAANVIRKITTAGIESVWVGTVGTSGSADGTGSSARFSLPAGVAVDRNGNVYVADTGNATIRKITSEGVVTTLAGSASNRGNSDGSGAAATFNSPAGITVDSVGNIYVADALNATIRKITSSGAVTTLAGSALNRGSVDGQGTAARFNNPNGIVVDASGNLYVADTFNDTIRKVTSGGLVTTLAGLGGVSGASDGGASSALFNLPYGLTLDSSGNLYVADTGNSTIRKVTPAGAVTTPAGLPGIAGLTNGSGGNALFNQPRSLTVDSSGSIFVADTGNAVVRKLAADGSVTVIVLSEATTPPPSSGGTTTPAPTTGGSASAGSSGGGGGGAFGLWFVCAVVLLSVSRGFLGRERDV